MDQTRVVRKVDKVIHWINHYSVDSVVCFVNIYPLDSIIRLLNNWVLKSNCNLRDLIVLQLIPYFLMM